jgi:hypothetical protein
VVAVGYQNQQGLLYDYKYPRFWLDKTLLHSPFQNVIITAQKCTLG